MKLIILDHLKRWWLVWIGIGILNYFIAGSFLDNSRTISPVNWVVIFWISAFALNFDLQRGSGRVLITLPVSARHIGRAWWIFSVALPALFLAAISGLAMFLHSIGTSNRFPITDFALIAITYTLYLGSFFYLFIGSLPGWPQNPVMFGRMVVSIGFIIGAIIVKPDFDTPQGISLLLVAAIFTVLGWLRAEHMVTQRGAFRLGAQIVRSKSAQYKTPAGFGGMPFLWQNMLIRLGYFSLGFVAWMILTMILIGFMNGQLLHSPKQFFAATNPAINTFSYFFVYMFLLLPLMMHLRLLRTLPISTSSLASTLVFFPVGTIFIFHLALATFSRESLISANCLTHAALLAILVPLLVWLGSGTGTYLTLFVLVMMASLSPIFFHSSKIPPIVLVLVSVFVIGLAWEITKRLLQSSSKAYLVRQNQFTGGWNWGRQ